MSTLLKTKSLLTSPRNVLPLHPKQTFPPIILIFVQVKVMELNPGYLFKIFPTFHGTHMEVLAVKKNQSNFVIKCGTKAIFSRFLTCKKAFNPIVILHCADRRHLWSCTVHFSKSLFQFQNFHTPFLF